MIGGPEINTLNSEIAGPLSKAAAAFVAEKGMTNAAVIATQVAQFWRTFENACGVEAPSSCKMRKHSRESHV